MMRSLLALTVLLLSPELTQSAGKCNLSNPPKSWLTTKALGIMEWATAGISDQGEHFCVNRHPSGLVEANYHVNLAKGVNQESARLTQSHRTLWDNPYNQCILDDDQIHVCFPYCAKDKQKIAIKAALSSGNPRIVARSIERLVNTEDWAITVMKVDFNDPETHLNVTSFADPKVWCAIYIGIDPFVGSSYLYEIQLAKIIR